MKLNFAILLLPAASVYGHFSSYHHRHPFSSGVGSGPYGSGNRTATFGSSGLLNAPTGTTRNTIYSTVAITLDGSTSTIVESAAASLNEAGASLPLPSSCTQATVTVTEDATVTVTVSASENGTSEPVIPTQAPVPTQAGTSSPVQSVTASPEEASSSILSPTVVSAMTLAGLGPAPSSSTSTPAVADTPQTVETGPAVVPTSSTGPTVEPAATSATAAVPAGTPAASAAAPATNPSKAAKRGIIASGDDTDAITAAFANTKVAWLGNWYSGPPPNLTPAMGMEFVPQLYHPDSINDGSWASNTKKGIAAGDKYFMSFGEPDTSGISPETAVDDWMKDMQPYAAQGVKLGAPANLQNPQDMDWLSKFLDGCSARGCNIGFVCVHWFWTADPSGQKDFQSAVNKAIALAKGIPVWVDNFGATGSREAQIEFLTAMIPWLESNDAIERYGYVAINRTQGGFLPESGDGLSDLGKFYATF